MFKCNEHVECFWSSLTYVVGTHWNCLIEAIQCVPTTYVNSLNEFFHDQSFLTNFSTIFLGLSVMSM